MRNPLLETQKLGQSIWYDNIRRALLVSGELQAMIHDGILGVTSNPAIFQKAVAGSDDYDAAIRPLAATGSTDAKAIYEALAVDDIQRAADLLRPVYDSSNKRDGFISLEVSPLLAHDTRGTLDEARRLHAAVARPNVMIKVPATAAGMPAVRDLIAEGISVNVTLLFAVQTYERAAQAYVDGLERWMERGGDPVTVSSVASFFVSRIDSSVDSLLLQKLAETRHSEGRRHLEGLLGKVAIANAKVAYDEYRTIYAQERWRALAKRGARTQRLLWASTGTKDPKYSDTLYVDELIGAETVNTVPAATLGAFRDHGSVEPRLTRDWDSNLRAARDTLRQLEESDISLATVTDTLLDEGVRAFADSFHNLLAAIEDKRRLWCAGGPGAMTAALGPAQLEVDRSVENWRVQDKVRRLWDGDSTLWTADNEDLWLGWLDIVERQRQHQNELQQIADDVRDAGFTTILLLGMGGSSLCPEVMSRTFGATSTGCDLLVLDSTVPAQVKRFTSRIDPTKTLFIVSSKSGSTTEPNAFKQYFFELVSNAVGAKDAGNHFIAITDPGSTLHHLAKAERFRAIFHGQPTIGGRYSALSYFGMVPCSLMGMDVARFLDATNVMVQACAPSVAVSDNPGVKLGIILGTLAKAGRDKMTLIASPSIVSLGAWLEQLVAESLGKQGKGIVPIDGEQLGPPEVYGTDRLFVDIQLASAADPAHDAAVAALERAGHPVVRICMQDAFDLGQEFFRWEIATAVAGSVLGVNAFDQPDVEASKIATRTLTSAYEKTGVVPAEEPFFSANGIALLSNAENAAAIVSRARVQSLAGMLTAHLGRLGAGDYFALNSYVDMNAENSAILQDIRHAVRDHWRVATTLGFGPRFLHSTGQLHKGGPNSGVFLQVTCDDAKDVPVPGQRFSFGILKRFQAQGDFEVLAARKRRLLRVHLGAHVAAGLQELQEAVRAAAR